MGSSEGVSMGKEPEGKEARSSNQEDDKTETDEV